MRQSLKNNRVYVLLEQLGRERVRLHVFGNSETDAATRPGEKALARWITDEEIPAYAYDVIEELCLADSIDCPREIFTFKRATLDAAE